MGIIFLLMSVRLLFKRNGRFVNTHIGSNKAMKNKGVFCATTQDRMAQEDTIKHKPEHMQSKK